MNWEQIALIIALVLLVLAGGYIKKLSGAFTHLVVTFNNALQLGSDGGEEITRKEWADILEGGKGVFRIIAEIGSLVALKKRG